VIHEQMDCIQMAPIKFQIFIETHRNARGSPEIAFHPMDQMRLLEQDFSRWPFSRIVVPCSTKLN
jgi:hypothetical protein